jgi:hypothetical protein
VTIAVASAAAKSLAEADDVKTNDEVNDVRKTKSVKSELQPHGLNMGLGFLNECLRRGGVLK